MYVTALVIIEEVLAEDGKAPMDTGRTLKQALLFVSPPRKGEEINLKELVVNVDQVTHTPGTTTSNPALEVWVKLDITDFIALHRKDNAWSLTNPKLN